MTQSSTILALTMGDPAGIGPEITLKAWAQLKSQNEFCFAWLGCPKTLEQTAKMLELDIPIQLIDDISQSSQIFKHALPILPMPCAAPVECGTSSSAHAVDVIKSIEKSVSLARSGQVGAVVTNPINKASLKKADFPHPGHTEFLSALSDGATPVMMLAGGGLRTIPLTRHIPLKDVAGALSGDELVATATITHRALQDLFGIAQPRIAISGLNPHAGEEGVLGREEIEIITPAITELRAAGIDIGGPLPADTMFHEAARAQYDVAICMYHDQALIPVKMIGFEDGVNITLGLDFIRTSPDHGTALDIAPLYRANPGSLIAALKTAAQMASHSPGDG